MMTSGAVPIPGQTPEQQPAAPEVVKAPEAPVAQPEVYNPIQEQPDDRAVTTAPGEGPVSTPVVPTEPMPVQEDHVVSASLGGSAKAANVDSTGAARKFNVIEALIGRLQSPEAGPEQKAA